MDVLQEVDRIPGLPKPINPKQHSILDYITIGGFFLASGLMWKRNLRGAIAAMVNGAFVLSYTLLTDFEGNGDKPVSFYTHGKLDTVQAAMAAAAPTVLGFGEKHGKASWFFHGQAMNEVLVIRMTDWEAAEGPRARLRRVA